MEVDPGEVQRQLEALGYENIEPYLLQHFIKDLKKLIKYEKKHEDKENTSTVKTSTTNNKCIDAKQKLPVPETSCKNWCCINKNKNVFERLSCSKSVSSVGVQTEENYSKYSVILRKRPRGPVALHQFYQLEWRNHKAPGEKKHDRLRWTIRQNMMLRK
ncbi:uncharacterized protein LOC126841564 [Adelges cooleyi]|uniref:uncharacterized protein LOC126841564 n=1 Tax=Adelges cooleyi TaxID=133065 RepID=UPI00217FACF9|nr:uncharacterized protein LOC126841564 [Adelges cooleyi]